MKAVVARLDRPGGARGLDAEDALEANCGYGGRIDGVDTYRFRYLTSDGKHRWDLVVSEEQIRDIADGLLIEIEGSPFELARTKRGTPTGYPLLVWGPHALDALHVRDRFELETAIDMLHDASIDQPRFLRLWSAAEDQLVAALWDEYNALYVVESHEGYATSMGDSTLRESYVVADPEGHPLTVPLADCVSWEYARRALLQFVEEGDLGDVATDGRIPSSLLMMGEVDRVAAIQARGQVPTELARSSLGIVPSAGDITLPVELGMEVAAYDSVPDELAMPLGPLEAAAWARRLVDALQSRALIELVPRANLDDLTYQLAGLLEEHDSAAAQSLEAASWLARKIGLLRGVATMFASGEQLQVLLRRSRHE
ncbi:MAG TPA: hypothetical protein VM513_13570 [Kofleriaceae bacterium]|jgi:hypothetical protein|nr:hypothetical protein [Kofleriaceae bacterium]